MKALVTGGAGLIGSHLVDILLANGFKVRVFDNLEPPTHLHGKPSWVPTEAEFVEGDMRNRPEVEKALDGIDTVFHQAAFVGFAPEKNKYFDVNVTGTRYLFEIIKEKKLKIEKIVAASSQAVYGEGIYHCMEHGDFHPDMRPMEQLEKGQWEVICPRCGLTALPVPTPEEASLKPVTPYAISKMEEEQLVLQEGKENGVPATALRYSLTYGPRQSLSTPYTGICSIFSSLILNGVQPIIYEDGEQTRDFVFVEDIARANFFCYENRKTDFKALNVGTGKATSVLEFVENLNTVYGTDVKPTITNEFRPGEVRHLFSGTGGLGKLGFNAKTSLKKGLEKYAGWVKEQGGLKDYFSEGLKKMKAAGIIHKTGVP